MMVQESIYRKLQQHLDRLPVGFPATKSGSEIKVLKHIFTPEEAQIAICLTHRHETLDVILGRTAGFVESRESLEKHLAAMERKGGIEVTIRSGRKRYANIPLVVGMYEYQLGRLSPEFVTDFDAYMSEVRFGIDFISTELPQMRTIPIATSIRPELRVSTFDHIKLLLEKSDPPYTVFECICRKKKAMADNPCQVTDREETCFAVGSVAESVLRSGLGREISLNESIAILALNQKEGLVLQPSNTERAEFICSCCGCCCGMLGLQKMLPKPLDYWATNFYATIDESLCNGCGNCVKRCQVGAVTMVDPSEQGHPFIDLNRCIGCGVCIPTCPTGAVTLVRRSREVRPPRDREALYDTLLAHKKGNWGKLKVAGKFLIDALTTGQPHLLK